MTKFKQFSRVFSDELPTDIVKVGRRYYQAEPGLVRVKEKVASREAFSIGLPLGEEKTSFQPSLAFLGLLAKSSSKKVFLNKKAEWLFLCNRNIFSDNITKLNTDKGLVLVQSERDENLGLGELIQQRGKLILKPLLDRGDFLRRES